MQKIFAFTLLLSCFSFFCYGQKKEEKKMVKPDGKSNFISVGPSIPIGNFSNTHYVGFSADYFRSKRRFGKLKNIPSKRIGLIAGAGAVYYLGKVDSILSYSYRYANYMHGYLHGGVLFNYKKYGNISLTTGPGISFYNSTTRFVISANLQAACNINDKIAIAPALNLIKESGADPLWNISLKTVFAF